MILREDQEIGVLRFTSTSDLAEIFHGLGYGETKSAVVFCFEVNAIQGTGAYDFLAI